VLSQLGLDKKTAATLKPVPLPAEEIGEKN
jgi:hypothetical protein